MSDPKAREVVRTMFTAYARCRSYRDTGTFRDGRTTITFATRFRRPGRIFFEYVKGGERSAYWCQGVKRKVVDDFPDLPVKKAKAALSADAWYANRQEFEPNRALGMTIAGFTGISRGTGNTVPNLLFPKEVGAVSLADMVDLRYEGLATDRGVACDVVFSKAHGTRAWIDHQRGLLRRVVEEIGSGEPEEITEYTPEIDVPIRDDEMTFVPPRKRP